MSWYCPLVWLELWPQCVDDCSRIWPINWKLLFSTTYTDERQWKNFIAYIDTFFIPDQKESHEWVHGNEAINYCYVSQFWRQTPQSTNRTTCERRKTDEQGLQICEEKHLWLQFAISIPETLDQFIRRINKCVWKRDNHRGRQITHPADRNLAFRRIKKNIRPMLDQSRWITF